MNDKTHKQRGVSLIAAVFIIVILAFMGLMLISMVNTSVFSSANDLQSMQALYVAEGGIEHAKLQFTAGTTCINLTNINVLLGPGMFTTTGALYNPPAPVNLQNNIDAFTTTIPVSANPAVNGYAPQGRITIGSEAIWYGGISGNSFINARRGVGGTTAAAHNAFPVLQVLQNQCRIVSTGNVGSAQRRAIVDMQGTPPSGLDSPQSFDGPTTLVSTGTTSIGSLTTSFGSGDNLIIAIVVLQNITNNAADINTGNLRLREDTTTLEWNRSLIRVRGPATTPGTNYSGDNIAQQKTHFLLYRHTGAPANATYNITAQATAANRIYATVRMIVLHNLPLAFGSNDDNVRLGTSSNGTVLASHATGLPPGDNLILAAVQLDQTTNNDNRLIDGGYGTDDGDLRLRKGSGTGTVLNSNYFDIDFETSANAKRGLSYLLIARDTTGANNQTYTVTGSASNNNSIYGAVSMLVLQGPSFAYSSTGINPVDMTSAITNLSSVATTFPAGHNIVISATQVMNYDWYNRNILTDRLAFSGGGVTSSNVVPIYLHGSLTNDDYATGILLYHQNAPANATYYWQAQADPQSWREPIRAYTDMAVINISGGGGAPDVYGWQ